MGAFACAACFMCCVCVCVQVRAFERSNVACVCARPHIADGVQQVPTSPKGLKLERLGGAARRQAACGSVHMPWCARRTRVSGMRACAGAPEGGGRRLRSASLCQGAPLAWQRGRVGPQLGSAGSRRGYTSLSHVTITRARPPLLPPLRFIGAQGGAAGVCTQQSSTRSRHTQHPAPTRSNNPHRPPHTRSPPRVVFHLFLLSTQHSTARPKGSNTATSHTHTHTHNIKAPHAPRMAC